MRPFNATILTQRYFTQRLRHTQRQPSAHGNHNNTQQNPTTSSSSSATSATPPRRTFSLIIACTNVTINGCIHVLLASHRLVNLLLASRGVSERGERRTSSRRHMYDNTNSEIWNDRRMDDLNDDVAVAVLEIVARNLNNTYMRGDAAVRPDARGYPISNRLRQNVKTTAWMSFNIGFCLLTPPLSFSYSP